MILTSALLITLLIMTGGGCCLHCYQRLGHYRQMANGTEYITLVEKVLEHLPQHRGMANTFINGDMSFLEKMKGMQQTLDQDINAIDHYCARHQPHADITQRWQTIKTGWHRLRGEIQSLTAEESFERHSHLISEVLCLISDAADRTCLTAHPEPNMRKIIQTTFNLLPPIIENIGQARGIGSGAAARGTLITTVRIKLEFLHERLGHNASSAYSTIEQCMGRNSSSQISNSREQTRQFLETISNRLLGDKITITAADYFSAGTTAFNSNLALLSEITTSLEQQINGTIPKLKTSFIWSITLGVGGAILLISIWWNLMLT